MRNIIQLMLFLSLAACGAQTRIAQAPRDPARAPVATYTGLSAPASVLYDADADRYLVSNVNGKALDKDDNGFISVLSPDGRVISPKWIAGGVNGVRLDAP